MQAALELLIKFLAGIANFLYVQIVDTANSVKSVIAEKTNELVTKFDELIKTVTGVQNTVSESVKATTEQLQQIQQQHKDYSEPLLSIANDTLSKVNDYEALIKVTNEKVVLIAESVNAGIDSQKIEEAFYKTLHSDIAKSVQNQ